jgi:hypothetical protein
MPIPLAIRDLTMRFINQDTQPLSGSS